MVTFNQIILSKETQSVVKSLARRIAGRDKYLEQDLVQEAYVILQKVEKHYNPQKGVPFWGFAHVVLSHALPRVARSYTQVLSIDEQDVIESLDEPEGYEAARNVLDCNLTPCERYELEDTRRAVRKAVELLPRNERIAVSLLYGLDGLYERRLTNVAEELHCSVEGASKICDRAVNRLRVSFGGPEYRLCA